MKQTYGFVPKTEVINIMKKTIELLENSEEMHILVTFIDTEDGKYESETNTMEEGIAMVNKAISIAYSSSHVLGSVDLFDYHVNDVKKINTETIKMKNILFPLRTNTNKRSKIY